MKATRLALGSLLFVALFSSASTAQVQRTFVSGLGDDGNPCSRTSPCRTISHALMGTNAGGEVIVLDSAGYGAFSITHAVSITAPPGVYAGISVFSGNGIDINAAGSDTIILRGLTINNQGSTGSGIVFHNGGTLHIENCLVSGFSGGGVQIGVSFLNPGALEVKDSTIRGNDVGIFTGGFPGGVSFIAIDQVRLEGNHDGLNVEQPSKATIRNSLASGNVNGIVGQSQATDAAVEVTVENCLVFNNGSGITALSTLPGLATVRVSNSTVTNNSIGLNNCTAIGPGLLLLRGNNTVEGNTANTCGTIGSYSAK